MHKWSAQHGDRKVELVVMGCDIDHAVVKAAFDQALLTDAEFAGGQQAWDEFDDPLPQVSE